MMNYFTYFYILHLSENDLGILRIQWECVALNKVAYTHASPKPSCPSTWDVCVHVLLKININLEKSIGQKENYVKLERDTPPLFLFHQKRTLLFSKRAINKHPKPLPERGTRSGQVQPWMLILFYWKHPGFRDFSSLAGNRAVLSSAQGSEWPTSVTSVEQIEVS